MTRSAAARCTQQSGPPAPPAPPESVPPAPGLGNGGHRSRRSWIEVAFAAAAFAALCIAVLSVRAQSAEPDDGAYRASIVGITDGHLLTLSGAQARALAASLHDNPAAPPNQWVRLGDGRYISEKDPGYPFLAAPFQALGVIRWAPLFYGALACVGLFSGARRWLGRFGGPTAVGLYCSSGVALAFAWRDYMPTFTDTSLVAAGSGTLLWTLLATEASTRRRTWAGLAGFVAIELATFVRYTDIVVLGCAVIAATVAQRVRAIALPLPTLWCWLASVAAFGIGVALFDGVVYGAPLTTGYQPGEVTFATTAIAANLRIVPADLIRAMPALVLAFVALGWIFARWLLLRRSVERTLTARRDLAVGLAIAGSWLAIWGLYATYTWTTDPTNLTVQVARFYVPALGAISALGAWPVTRIPARIRLAALIPTVAVVALFVLGIWAFHAMYAEIGVPLHG